MNVFKNLFFIATIAITIISCSDSVRESVSVPIEHTEQLIKDLKGSNFSIVLNDMNINEENGKDLFQHKYHILKVEKDSLLVDSLGWKTVNKKFFLKHENNLGMEIVSNHNNKLSRIARPVGFDWAVGNEKEGQWQEEDSTKSNSSSVRRRYWQSNHSSGLFWYWMLRRRNYRRDYAGYKAYKSTDKTYYGNSSGGNAIYGTNSAYQKSKRSSFFTRKSSSSIWKSYSSRKSASSSRYNGASTTRSKSGGFGK